MKFGLPLISVASVLWILFGALVDLRAQELPPGVPSPIGKDGKYTSDWNFTTEAYAKEAFRLVLQEANQLAKDMQLPEKLPIKESDVASRFIAPFGYAYVNKSIGNITTQNYWYNVREGNKLSGVNVANFDQRCLEYQEKYQLPVSRIDTNTAYQLATQWLAASQMDVKALNRDCKVDVKLSEYWNGIKPGGKLKKKTFVPIYDVVWLSPKNRRENFGDVAYVNLFAPTKTLLQMSIEDPKYILRKPIVFTNLAELLTHTNGSAVSNAPARK